MTDCGDAEEMHVKSVYYTADSIISVFKSDSLFPLVEVQQLLHIYNEAFPGGIPNYSLGNKRKPFVVFEGLDGSGKSTIAKCVAKRLGGVTRATPPKSLSFLRTKFDEHNDMIRRAFYSLGNYIAAHEIQTICEKQPVFLDRFWHSTAAYAIAHEFQAKGASALPPSNNPIYRWPNDLLKPDMVIFLEVTEEERNIRHARRKQTTKEENQLAKNESFRNLVLAAYKNMNDPPFVYVDSTQNLKKAVQACIDEINVLNLQEQFQNL